MDIRTFAFEDDGRVPNNSKPLILYESAFLREGTAPTAGAVMSHLQSNGWRGAWLNGIYPFHHYHARSHEVLVNVGGAVQVQFGGESGEVLTFSPGAAVVIPAGVGHCRLSPDDRLAIVGAYPAGQEDWDLKRADSTADYKAAQEQLARITLPTRDPVTGQKSPLLDHWR
ncbi:MAG: cupin [Alphaproteobacteria bacterium]|nr:cupin [Alphaproteobacteria bacterium]